jgi:hypothetical protein
MNAIAASVSVAYKSVAWRVPRERPTLPSSRNGERRMGVCSKMPCQQSKHYLGIRYDPGMFSSSVARTAPFALASVLK